MRGTTWLWALLYLLAAGGVLGGFAAMLEANEGGLRQWALDYLFPESWQWVASQLVELLLANQVREVRHALTLAGSLVLVSALLFPIKERLSASFERRSLTGTGPHREPPLWRQGLDELEIVIGYVAIQLTLLRWGLTAGPELRPLIGALSTGFIVVTFAIDFTAPILQRHGYTHGRALRLLARRPLAALSFGLVFAAPGLIAVRVFPPGSESLWKVFAVQVLAFAAAAVAGTRFGAGLLPLAHAGRRWPTPAIGITRLSVGALFAWQAYFFGAIALATHHKSQLLKCSYEVHWRSARVERVRVVSLLAGTVEATVAVDLAVHNPTRVDVALENLRFDVRHDQAQLAAGHLAPARVPAGERATVPLELTLALQATALKAGLGLFEDKYRVTLFLDAAPGVVLPIHVHGAKK